MDASMDLELSIRSVDIDMNEIEDPEIEEEEKEGGNLSDSDQSDPNDSKQSSEKFYTPHDSWSKMPRRNQV